MLAEKKNYYLSTTRFLSTCFLSNVELAFYLLKKTKRVVGYSLPPSFPPPCLLLSMSLLLICHNLSSMNKFGVLDLDISVIWAKFNILIYGLYVANNIFIFPFGTLGAMKHQQVQAMASTKEKLLLKYHTKGSFQMHDHGLCVILTKISIPGLSLCQKQVFLTGFFD
jgi:hypothetical protein